MSEKTTKFNPVDMLETQAEINDYLQECYNDDDPKVFVNALGYLAKHHGMTEVAKSTGLTRASLYKTFDGKTKPQWDTIHRLLKVLGVGFTVA